MDYDDDEPREKLRVDHLLRIRSRQLQNAERTEYLIMMALWKLRGVHRVEDMVKWTGWSKQTIYNKWDKHGLRKADAQSTGD